LNSEFARSNGFRLSERRAIYRQGEEKTEKSMVQAGRQQHL